MFKCGLCHLVSVLVLVTVLPTTSWGQWRTQDIKLEPGWNAVFLEVQPEPSESDVVFQGMPVESVWAWNQRFSSVQFVQDASTLMPDQPEWLHYFPRDSERAFLTNLFAVQGGQPYLIKLGGPRPVTWQVTGRALLRAPDWMADSFNLVGFYVDPASQPTFQDFFSASPAHSGTDIHQLDPSGEWALVNDPEARSVQPGEAYWVYCRGSSMYPGPLSVTLEQAGALDFGRILTEQPLRIRNETNSVKQVILTPKPSVTPPAAAFSPLAGGVPLSYWDSDSLDWVDFLGALEVSIAPKKQATVRVAVRRPDMAPSGGSALYQSLVEVTDNEGTCLSLPVVSRGLGDGGAGGGSGSEAYGAAADGPPSSPTAGLWVGAASIDKVSFAAHPSDKATPTPAASEMQIRLLVHVDASGQARLLQHVTLMWKEGTQKPDPADPTKYIVDEPGRFVLVTRDELLSQFSGAAVRDGKQVGRRMSSAAFGFSDPVPLSGVFGGTLESGPITIDYDDPLNPFKHKYHPDHDNLDPLFQSPRQESYTVVRNIQLHFSADDPEALRLPGWGDSQMGGIYHENIAGLHKEILYVEGSFRLHQASRTSILNDGL